MSFPSRRRPGPAGIAALVLLAAGCGSLAPARGAPRAVLASEEVAMDSAGLVAGPGRAGAGGSPEAVLAVTAGDSPEPSPLPSAGPRLLIYSGVFSVAVPSVEDALEAARRMAESLGGWVQALHDDTIVIRVPAARWDEARAGLRDLGRVLSRAIEAQDVTEEVVDLRLRLTNARALRKRLEELLAQAESVEVTLKVEAELHRVRTEIERLEGRLKLVEDRVAFSTLTIRFVPVEQAPTRLQALPFPWLRQLGLETLLGLSGGVR